VIEKNGLEILILDFGVMGEPAFAPDITRQEVVKAGGGDLATLASGAYKDEAMRVMAAGLATLVHIFQFFLTCLQIRCLTCRHKVIFGISLLLRNMDVIF